MDVVNEVKDKAKKTVKDGRGKGSATKRILVPLAASAASGATAYCARKLPGLVQEKVLPKLKESGGSGEAIAKAKDAVTERLPSAGGDATRPSGTGGSRSTAQNLSTKEREQERKARAER